MSASTPAQQLLTKATAFYHSGDYRQAIQVWQEVLAQDPKNQRALEGIRMASLLLEEAQAGESSHEPASEAGSSETTETIAKVREGIQKVREFLSSARYLDAMEVCQALLQLAPRSEAVREVLEEARDAYEAQPFIAEHLEIARQLFVQERLDEAAAEIQKIFFLSPNHGEAKKLEAKIEALRQKQSGGPAGSESSGEAARPVGVDTQRLPAATPAPPPQTPIGSQHLEAQRPDAESIKEVPASGGASDPILNENWEAELAQIDLEPSGPTEKRSQESTGNKEDTDSIPLTDLSENPIPRPVPSAAAESSPASGKGLGKGEPDLDFSGLGAEILKESPETAQAPREATLRRARSTETTAERPRISRAQETRQTRSGLPLGKTVLVFALLLSLLGGGWWMLSGRSGSGSGQNGGSNAPPVPRPPLKRPAPDPSSSGGPSNVGLSSNSSRPANTASAQGASTLPEVLPPPTRSPEEVKREISSLFATGKSQLAQSRYDDAIVTFSKILDLDPANVEAKENLDSAAGKVQEQHQLEQDLQEGKQFFVEKDYESALRKFYRLPKDRNLGEVDLFIRNAWFNYAVVSMKGGNCVEALQRLEEDLSLHPEDQEAAKLKEVAEHYRDRPKDKVFYAYVDRLTYRTLNQK